MPDEVATMSMDAKLSQALLVFFLLSIAAIIKAVSLIIPAQELILYAYLALVVGAFLTLYELPAIVAYRKKHPRFLAILCLNILLGWTIIGWIVALVWACTGNCVHNSTLSPTIQSLPPAPLPERLCITSLQLLVERRTLYLTAAPAPLWIG
jgi:hypothetical protein